MHRSPVMAAVYLFYGIVDNFGIEWNIMGNNRAKSIFDGDIMVRKACLITLILIILFCASPSGAYIDQTLEKKDSFDIVRETFLVSGAQPGEIKLQAGGQITNKKLSLIELEEIFYTLTKELELENAQPAVQIEKDMFTSISIITEGENLKLQLVLQSISETPASGATYLGFLLSAIDMEKANGVYKKMLPLLREIGYTDELGITISGIINKNFCETMQVELVQLMARSSEAQFAEGISGNLTSFSFYTPQINNYLWADDKKINLQIASRAYPDEEVTKIHVASPLIFQDY